MQAIIEAKGSYFDEKFDARKFKHQAVYEVSYFKQLTCNKSIDRALNNYLLHYFMLHYYHHYFLLWFRDNPEFGSGIHFFFFFTDNTYGRQCTSEVLTQAKIVSALLFDVSGRRLER